MNNIIQNVFSVIVITFTNVYIWSKILNKVPNFKKIKTYVIFFLMAVSTLANYFYNNQFFKILTITFIMTFFFKFLFDEKMNRSILGAVTSQMIYMVSEIIFAIIVVSILKLDTTEIVNVYFGSFITNFCISLITIFISNFKFIRKCYMFLTKSTDKITRNQLIMFLFLVVAIANIITMTMYYKVNIVWLFIINTIIIIICFGAVIYTLMSKNRYIKVYDKYNTTLDSLREYEDILNKYRVSNHENKNQLLMIRNMSKNKKICNYIDEIVDNKLKDNDKLMFEVSVIPEGGLRGLIYSKLLYMKENNIKGELSVDKKVKTVDLIDVDSSLMLDICKVVGVFIDNAIEEVMKLEDKYVEIDIYIEDSNLSISVSNNYEGIIDLENLDTEGYTTKGEGHGYGLSLVKEIIESNRNLNNLKSITDNTFTQILEIKM